MIFKYIYACLYFDKAYERMNTQKKIMFFPTKQQTLFHSYVCTCRNMHNSYILIAKCMNCEFF